MKETTFGRLSIQSNVNFSLNSILNKPDSHQISSLSMSLVLITTWTCCVSKSCTKIILTLRLSHQ